jgi:cytochrome c556
MTHKWTVLALAALGVAAIGTAGVAQDKAAIVKDRQTFMKGQGADAKAIADYGKGMATKEDALKAIADLQAKNPKMLALFVAGTSMTDLPGVSYAKANIWTEKADFAKSITALGDMETAMAETIKTGAPEAVGAAAGDLGRKGCGGCHTNYREKKPS